MFIFASFSVFTWFALREKAGKISWKVIYHKYRHIWKYTNLTSAFLVDQINKISVCKLSIGFKKFCWECPSLFIIFSFFLNCQLLSIYLSIYLSHFVQIYLSIYVCSYLSIYLSIYLSRSVQIYLSIYLSMSVHIYLSIYLSQVIHAINIYVYMYVCTNLSIIVSLQVRL